MKSDIIFSNIVIIWFTRSVNNGGTFVRSLYFEDIKISRWYYSDRYPGQVSCHKSLSP